MTLAKIEIPEAQIGELCPRSGIRRRGLFGSVLTGRFSDASDIDVLVVFRSEERVGSFRLPDIDAELSGLLEILGEAASNVTQETQVHVTPLQGWSGFVSIPRVPLRSTLG